MSIHQTKKQSDLEKRLQLIRRQVYGKNSENQIKPDKSGLGKKSINSDTLVYRNTDAQISPGSSMHRSNDLTYLHQDLFKILIFSSLAIGSQIILFFLSKNHILNLNFF